MSLRPYRLKVSRHHSVDKLVFSIGDLAIGIELVGASQAAVDDVKSWLYDYQSEFDFENAWSIRTTMCENAAGFYGARWQNGGIFLDGLVVNAVARTVEFKVPSSTYTLGRWGVPFAFHLSILGGLVSSFRGTSKRLLHAGAVALNAHEAVLVTGPSGAGKSSLCRVLGPTQLGDEATVVSIDKSVVTVCGTPIPGELRALDTRERKLRAVLIPGTKDTPSLSFRSLKGAEGPRRLIQTTVRLQGDSPDADLDWFEALIKEVPVYEVNWMKSKDFPRRRLIEVLA